VSPDNTPGVSLFDQTEHLGVSIGVADDQGTMIVYDKAGKVLFQIQAP
jgi:hypothetical protein